MNTETTTVTTRFTTDAADWILRRLSPEEREQIRLKAGKGFTGTLARAVTADGVRFGQERRVFRRNNGTTFTMPRNPRYGEPGQPKYLEEEFTKDVPRQIRKHPAQIAEEQRAFKAREEIRLDLESIIEAEEPERAARTILERYTVVPR